MTINCGALPDTLLESELFGHMKGAFTDAHQTKKGLFEAAHGGTLFLDEVGETSPAMQVKLLRALQDRRIRRVGGTDEIEVDVRVIAATNAPLETLVQREALPRGPLLSPPGHPRPRPAAARAARGHPASRRPLPAAARRARWASSVVKVSDAAMDILKRYSWPGNVRELENVIERAVALETTEAVLPERLPDAVRSAETSGAAAALGPGFGLDEHLRAIEARLLQQALAQAGGDRGRAAELARGLAPPASLPAAQARHPSSDKNWQA